MTYHMKMFEGGKVVIPAELRRELGLSKGDTLVIERSDDGQLVIKTFRQVVEDIQLRVKQMIKHPFTVDDFLAEKYREAELEEEKWERLDREAQEAREAAPK